MARAPSLTSFDPRFIEIWRRSATEIVSIPVSSRPEGVRLRARLYSCRKALQESGHEVATLAAYGSIKLREEKPNTWVVVIEPADKDLSAALDRAGITISDAPEIDFSFTEELP
jgi:hypothetical protein